MTATELGADILAALGLAREPFDNGTVAGLFYPGAGRQECAEQLQHLLRFRGHVLLFGGMEGSDARRSGIICCATLSTISICAQSMLA